MKRNIIITLLGIAVLTLGSTSSSFSQKKDKASANSKADAEVLRVINERRDALLRGDIDAYARQTADDYLAVGTNGRVRNKEEVLAGARSSDLKWISIEHSDLKIRVYGNTAVVTYISTQKGTSQGQEISDQRRFTQVLVKKQRHWQFVSMHQSSVEPPRTTQP
jgi:ketosteroid isomerase-like protein